MHRVSLSGSHGSRLTVVFPKPDQAVCDKWQLASSGDISHLICMPHVTEAQIDALLADMLAAQTPELMGAQS